VRELLLGVARFAAGHLPLVVGPAALPGEAPPCRTRPGQREFVVGTKLTVDTNYGAVHRRGVLALADIPLRPRKIAQTRAALLRAVLARLDGTRALEEINVRELCNEAAISEASFFNYFPKKIDLLVFFIRLWSLDLAWRIHHELAAVSARKALEEILVATARAMRMHPGVMPEIIAFLARSTTIPVGDLELADRLVAYPDRDGIETVPATGLSGLLPPLIARAIREGELPATTDRKTALLSLTSVFFGVPLMLWRRDPDGVEHAYRRQLAVAWAGLQAAPRMSRRSRPRAAMGAR
jgi:AcrR family transcriptional regulator